MLFLRDFGLWLLVGFHVVAGAALFRRLLPRESPWLGFVIPALVTVLVLNFVEHVVGFSTLVWLLPMTLAVGAVFFPSCDWKALRLPTTVFLVSFGLNFAFRCLHPDIPTDDAGADMNRILNYSFGEKLPPTDSWLPPVDYRWYYALQHYAASIVLRLFDLDIGTATNTSLALLNAMICTAGTGVAYLAGGRRAWVALAMTFVIEAGFSGAMPLLILTSKWPDFGYSVDVDAGWRTHSPHPLFHLLENTPHEALVLEPPGDWMWHPQYHANLSGFLLLFLAALAALEVLGERRGNVSWITLLLIPPLSFLAATWYLPLCALLCGGTLLLALILKHRPAQWQPVLIGAAMGMVLIGPALAGFASWPAHQGFHWTLPHEHTPFMVFVIQWWPVYVPWIVLCFFWRGLSIGVRWMHGFTAVSFVLVELFTVGDWRWDTVEKMWGGLFGLGLAALMPPLMVSRHLVARILALILGLAALVTLGARFNEAGKWVDWDDGFLHLEGTDYLRQDPQNARLLSALSRIHGQTILAGICRWNYTPPVGLAIFTSNRCYVAWFSTEEICGHSDEVHKRTVLNNSFYAGTMPRPLAFLEENHIAAALIAPEDDIGDAVLSKLREVLAPDYEYVDCREGGTANAGVFFLRLPTGQRR